MAAGDKFGGGGGGVGGEERENKKKEERGSGVSHSTLIKVFMTRCVQSLAAWR